LAGLLQTLADGGIRIDAPELKRVPSGFPKDHPHADLLRRKGLTAWIDFDDPAQALGPDMVAACRDGFKRLKPLFDSLRAL
jgi:uncharacterized protein (DUF2461 family)